jgi:hypothetical protein
MNEPTKNTDTRLLDSIRQFQLRVGDGLKDGEFTLLLQKSALPEECGFSFLSYGDSFVMLSVPRQDLADWYPEKGWIKESKEKKARNIADKYELTLCEPPDVAYTRPDLPDNHHHLELSDRRETIIIIHPEYLKIRLFTSKIRTTYAPLAKTPLIFSPNLLYDLSALYRS